MAPVYRNIDEIFAGDYEDDPGRDRGEAPTGGVPAIDG